MLNAFGVGFWSLGCRCVESCGILCGAGVDLVWFDSFGAKSAAIRVGGVLVDPGAAAMQPSYPLPGEEKSRLRSEAVKAIEERASSVDVLIITHYHYDHHLLPSDPTLSNPATLYCRKTILAKNPNMYINRSQWERARLWLSQLLSLCGGGKLEDYLIEPRKSEFEDPVEELVEAHSRDWGDYAKRRIELLRKGRKSFEKLARLWASGDWVEEKISLSDGTNILFVDEGVYEVNNVRVKLLGPHFHGIEYDATGWVVPVLLETNNYKLLFTSDLMGPIIEDYAFEILSIDPDILVADGPPTYLFPYMFNRVNLRRAVDNMVRIILESQRLKLVVYDHHLLREKRWRQRVAEVFKVAEKAGIPVLTAAECLGEKPLIDRL